MSGPKLRAGATEDLQNEKLFFIIKPLLFFIVCSGGAFMTGNSRMWASPQSDDIEVISHAIDMLTPPDVYFYTVFVLLFDERNCSDCVLWALTKPAASTVPGHIFCAVTDRTGDAAEKISADISQNVG